MKVSVIIPFYNCPYVDQAIKSALNQTYQNIEVIVVDDGSTQHVEKIKPFINRIKYLKKANGGTASALNYGLKHATGQYFAWLSSDDMFLKTKIERQLTFMKSTGALVSYTAFISIDANNKAINQVHSIQMSRKKLMRQLLKGCPINGCTVIADINLIKRSGFFDESFKYAQDYEMWCRLILDSSISYLDEALILYRVHNSMGSVKHANGVGKETLRVKNKYKKFFQLYSSHKKTNK
ncbi:glycosyltransferase involved in cell wall biosynthesis [Bacillus pakistanensis]|uniref:Glycosyltransferase involved in cell wall biosynthesis n=1 Tax=Rossellomorea pakistanensis TaxID=992288 RepID=A0ABS2NGN6_9BACI|nr:glycosyltransferase [Bacillus pakistanensis]MBM7586924.1 glycosyltransferase involved in cell wall biosynthesis [Bacillus pakistanensis]